MLNSLAKVGLDTRIESGRPVNLQVCSSLGISSVHMLTTSFFSWAQTLAPGLHVGEGCAHRNRSSHRVCDLHAPAIIWLYLSEFLAPEPVVFSVTHFCRFTCCLITSAPVGRGVKSQKQFCDFSILFFNFFFFFNFVSLVEG